MKKYMCLSKHDRPADQVNSSSENRISPISDFLTGRKLNCKVASQRKTWVKTYFTILVSFQAENMHTYNFGKICLKFYFWKKGKTIKISYYLCLEMWWTQTECFRMLNMFLYIDYTDKYTKVIFLWKIHNVFLFVSKDLTNR